MSGDAVASARPETPAWVRDAVFYQIFPDRFARSGRVVPPGPLEPWDTPPTVHGFKGGDLLGVAEHLDHLEALGVTAIYFNPVLQSASNHRYHTYDYFRVDPLLGGDAALRELIDACHARGMRILLDGVFNHASRGFWPFNHVLETGRHSPYVGWFYFHADDLASERPIRAYPLERVAVDVATVTDEQRAGSGSLSALGYQAWWGLPALPKLNTSNPHARAYLLSAAEHWIRFGADGWRLDVAEEVPDDFWREFRQRVKAVDPDAYMVAEVWHEKPGDLRGDMYDALMNYPLAEAILSFVAAGRLDRRVIAQHFNLAASVRDEDAATFAARLERALTIYDPNVTAVQLNLLDSHDTPRFLTMAGGDTRSLELATLIQMTLPGAPSIYYGDEIGLQGELDPFSRGSFPWDHPERWDHGLLATFTVAAALRHAHRVLRHGVTRIVATVASTIAYLRFDGHDVALVVVNAGDQPCELSVELPQLEGRTFVGAAWRGPTGGGSAPMPGAVRVVDGRLELLVPPRDGAVLIAE